MTTPFLTLRPTFQFNVRSFHPEKNFGWSGLYFDGDNRGFSNKPSDLGNPTSRIWHLFHLNTAEPRSFLPKTKSDPSKAPWDTEKRTYGAVLAPKATMLPMQVRPLANGIINYRVDGRYGGVNHAMPGSPEMQKTTGMSYVPTLDVHYQIVLDVDSKNRHVDIVAYVSGDGFPNCEAFVVDASGQAVFLGVHVRKGAAPLTLALNLEYPMIACAIRLPIDAKGNFCGTIGDELSRKKNGLPLLKFQKISDWNEKFLKLNPNYHHCMALEKSSLEGCFKP